MAGTDDFDTKNYLKQLSELRKKHAALRASLREMLDAYWGEGDGARPPEFVLRAMKLSGYRHRKKQAALPAEPRE